jgi:hypothetical protein
MTALMGRPDVPRLLLGVPLALRPNFCCMSSTYDPLARIILILLEWGSDQARR